MENSRSMELQNNIDEELLYNVAAYCIETKAVNMNSTQLNFGLKFNAVQEVLNKLEKRGVLSAKQGTKGRNILVDKEQLKKIFR